MRWTFGQNNDSMIRAELELDGNIASACLQRIEYDSAISECVWKFFASNHHINLAKYEDPRAELEWRSAQVLAAGRPSNAFIDWDSLLDGAVQFRRDGSDVVVERAQNGWRFRVVNQRGDLHGRAESLQIAVEIVLNAVWQMG